MTASDYQSVAPEDGVKPISEIGWSPALVDYNTHAHYQALTRSPSLRLRLEAMGIFAASMIKLLGKRLIKYEFIPFHIRRDRSPAGRLRFLGAGLKNVFKGDGRARRLSASPQEAGRMAEHGIHVLTMPSPRFDTLQQAAEPAFDALAARRGKSNGKREFEESRGPTSRTDQPDLYKTVETLLVEAGVMGIASAYLGRKAGLIDLNPQINDVSDTFWRDIFPDADLGSLPPTAYCHRDSSGGDLKAIIYMNDVSDENGPFSYVVGSNRMKVRRLDDLICEANDSNGLGGTGQQARARFAALPAKLRQKGSFGNDLDDSTAFARDIVGGLWSVTAPQGSIVLFDTKGIHRGGMVERGERRVITCIIG
jgi:ectoine hydroxylase-related dioxygenase (phytanoyl-CoA dioxygenase family)